MPVPIRIAFGLPFVAVTLEANGQTIILPSVLLDTGSAATLFKTDDLEKLSIYPEPHDIIRRVQGVGGIEVVVEKTVAALEVGELRVSPFQVQAGALNYGIPMDGILGLDFLFQSGAQIDLQKLELRL